MNIKCVVLSINVRLSEFDQIIKFHVIIPPMMASKNFIIVFVINIWHSFKTYFHKGRPIITIQKFLSLFDKVVWQYDLYSSYSIALYWHNNVREWLQTSPIIYIYCSRLIITFLKKIYFLCFYFIGKIIKEICLYIYMFIYDDS